MDSTFLNADFQQTLLLAVTVDANGDYLLLAWAIVESENTESWTYFFEHLNHGISQVLDASIMSDCEKGLHAGLNTLGVGIVRLHCLEQLRQNFTRRHTQKHEGLFWRIANATTEVDFETAVAVLRFEQAAAATYLLSIDRTIWVTAFIPGGPVRRYGQQISNPVEAMNSILQKAQELSVLDLLAEIWHHTMETRLTWLQNANSVVGGQIFTPYCEKILP